MPRSLPAGGAILTAAMFCGTTAFADVSARDVWEDMQVYMERTGYQLEAGSEEMTGDTLTLRDVSAVFALGDFESDGDVDSEARIDFSPLILRENGDGSVGVFLPERYTITIEGIGDDGELAITTALRRTDLTITASGDPDETVYDTAAGELSMALEDLKFNGQAIEEDANFNLRVGLSGYEGRYTMSGDDVIRVRGSGQAEAVDVAIRMDVPGIDDKLDFIIENKGMSFTSHLILPEGFDPEDMAQNLANGFASEGEYTMGDTGFALSVDTKGDRLDTTGTFGNIAFAFAMDKNRLSYSDLATDMSLAVSIPDTPMPKITVTAAEYGSDLLIPLSKSGTPQDFALGLNLTGLSLEDDIWNLFDPAGVVPRDPATLTFDLSGKGNWLFDILAPDVWETPWPDETLPGELHELSLNDMRLSVAGAELTGTGRFTFDNDDLETFDGAPRPEGAVSFSLTGAGDLLNKLVEGSLLPPDMALGAHMMMGLFFAPGAGEDELTTTLEVNAEGHVIANGQRVR